MRTLPWLILTSLLCGAGQPMLAQIKPSRTVLVEPLDVRAAPGVAADAWFAAEAFRGWGSYEDEQAWQYRMHGGIEPFRFGEDSTAAITTSLQFHSELTASSKNALGFNPRTARWEEMLLVHLRASPLTLQAGWFHRCKHEIDNSEPPDDADDPSYQPTRRVLIVSGPMAMVVSPALTTPLGRLRVTGGAEWYVVNDDYRTPDSIRTGSWTGLQGAVWARGQVDWTLSRVVEAGASYYISFPIFRDRFGAPDDIVVPHEAHAEAAIRFHSERAVIAVVAAADHTWDEVAWLTAQPTTVVQIGVRFSGR